MSIIKASPYSGSPFIFSIVNKFGIRLKKDIIKNKYVYIMAIPVLLYYIIFHYIPMYGTIIAFKDFTPSQGILDSKWIGFDNFSLFFSSYYFFRLIRNTLLISVYGLIFGFPFPIIFALALNELNSMKFKRTVQTISYLPHFISTVVVCGMIIDFLSTDGIINQLFYSFGGKPISLLTNPNYFRSIFISTDIWQQMGWNSIIYIAALSSVDVQLYDAAAIDGAGRWRRIYHIEIPSILPTIVILLILRIGSTMQVGFEKILLLYNGSTYETADVISTFVYRKGILQASYSYSAAIGLFNSIINFILLISANKISKMFQETSLW